jgi:lipid-binding SYLF domain-containing protein
MRNMICGLALGMLALGLLGCSTEPKGEEAKASLRDDAQSTLSQFTREDPGFRGFLDRGRGYVIFPSVGKGGLGVGGAYGRGEVYEGGKMIGYADLTQGSIGLQAGGQTYSEVIVFENEDALNRFKNNKLEFAANASAVALKAGASAAARFENGIAVFTKPKGGLMFEASIGGQKFNFKAADRAEHQQHHQQ